MQLKSIHVFLVNPEKNVDELSKIDSLNYKDRAGKIYFILKDIFDNSGGQHNCDIIFAKPEDGSQKNDVREAILQYIHSRTLTNGKKIASRLSSVTTKRSGQGLLFLIFGEHLSTKRLVISRFPADTGIQADLSSGHLDIKYVDKLFLKNTHLFKSVSYEGSSDGEFWEGKVLDKQVGRPDVEISQYWIFEFLKSKITVTSARGTRRLAEAIKAVINHSENLTLKKELTSAIAVAQNIEGTVGNVRKILTKLNIKNEYQAEIVNELGEDIASESFQFSSDELFRFLSYKTIELDNGAFLTAPTNKFDEVIKTTLQENGKTELSTQGKIVDETIKKG